MRGNGTKRQNLFAKLIVSYLLVLIIPLLIGSFVYREALRMVEEDAMTNNLSLLEQTKDVLDARLEEVGAISKQLAMDERLITLVNARHIETGSKEYFKVWNYVEKSPKYNLTNNFLADYYIFFKNNQWVVSSDGAFPGIDTFYNHSFRMPDRSEAEFTRLLWENGYQSRYVPEGVYRQNGKEQRVVSYIQPIPFLYYGQPQGVILILLKESAIRSLLQQIDTANRGLVYITDNDGHIITQVGGANLAPGELTSVTVRNGGTFRSAAGEKFIVSKTASVHSSWQYVSVIPAELVLSKVAYIRYTTLTVMFVTLVLGAAVAIYLAYRNAKPVRDMLKNITDFFGGESIRGGSEYDYLNRRILDLIHNNKSLEREMENQLPLLRMSFYRRLLYGEAIDVQEAEAYLPTGLQHRGDGHFAAAVLRFDGYGDYMDEHVLKEAEMIRVLVKDRVAGLFPEHGLTYDMDENHLALVVALSGEGPDDCRTEFGREIAKLDAELGASYRIRLFYALGEAHPGIPGISRSFEEARQALEYARYGGRTRIVAFGELPKDNQSYYFPIETELRLVSLVKSGDTDEVGRAIDKLYEENIVNRTLSPQLIAQLIHMLAGSLSRIGHGESGADDAAASLLQELQNARGIEDMFGHIREAYRAQSERVNEQKHSAKRQLCEELEEYIRSRHTEEDMTLYQVAAHFGLTEGYLYPFFKEHMGMTFADYLEKVRIDHACRLLTDTDTSVKDVALGVGYASDHSFRRAFKRVVGILPTEYARALKN